ncbi:MAG TPA: uracil-DNA glycosylase [Planctomycetes bacterium]|nr:uracil-DNA glycosylase [Planctomycetota bacterium]
MHAPPPDPRHELASLTRGLKHAVRRAGHLGQRRARAGSASTLSNPGDPPEAPKPEDAPGPQASPPPEAPSEQAASPLPTSASEFPDLPSLREAVARCRACDLCQTRNQTVFLDGDGTAGILFIGEAPGQNEDEQGVPFVGRAGSLLTDIIEKGMGLKRSEVAIANVLKCRPPGNRDPEVTEKAACAPWLERQIELLDPQVVIALGRHAAGYLLDSDASLGQMRGRVRDWRGRKLVVTYHPAFLLRSPSFKRDCWQDIQLAMEVLQQGE